MFSSSLLLAVVFLVAHSVSIIKQLNCIHFQFVVIKAQHWKLIAPTLSLVRCRLPGDILMLAAAITFQASKGCFAHSLKLDTCFHVKASRAFKVLCDKLIEEEAFTYWCRDPVGGQRGGTACYGQFTADSLTSLCNTPRYNSVTRSCFLCLKSLNTALQSHTLFQFVTGLGCLPLFYINILLIS